MRAKNGQKPLAGTYKLLLSKLPPLDTLSLRKRLCMAFLKWKLYPEIENAGEFVDLAKEFRKLSGRRGLSRTVVEKEARKLFRRVRTHRANAPSREAAREYAKGQRDRQEGIHSPEVKATNRERWIAMNKRRNATRNSVVMKEWVITPPDGEEFKVKGLSAWARDNGLDTPAICATANRPWVKETHKGYKARHADPVADAHIPWKEGYQPLPWDHPLPDD